MRACLVIAAMVWLEMLRRKDLYVLGVLLAGLLLALVSVDVFGLGGVVAHVKDVGLSVAWLFSWILAVVTSARQLPGEERSGTVYTMLAKPLTRGQFLVGKWLGSWTVSVAATLDFYVLVWVVVWLRGGSFPLVVLGQGIVLHAAALAVISSLALALSTRQHADAAASAAFVITGACVLVLPRVPAFLAVETGLRRTALEVLYYALPHLEVFDMRRRMVFSWGRAPWDVFAGVVLYGMLLTGALLLLAWLSYRRKRFSREVIG